MWRTSLAALCVLVMPVALSGCVLPEEASSGDEPVPFVAPDDPHERPTDPDHAWQTLLVRIDPSGPYRVGLPLPIAEDADVAVWSASVVLDGDAKVMAGQDRGRAVVWVEGTTLVTVTWTHDVEADEPGQCCAEDFLGAEWTTGPRVGSMDDLRFIVEAGAGELELLYRARSNLCGGDEVRNGTFSPGNAAGGILRAEQAGMWCA